MRINRFSSQELTVSKTPEEKALSGFDLLSAVFIDRQYNGDAFQMTDYFFLEDLKEDGDARILLMEDLGSTQIMVIYTDIYGNDMTECFDLKERGQ